MYIIVMDDGTTFGTLNGCKVGFVPLDVLDTEAWIRDNPAKLADVNPLENASQVEFNGDILVAPDMDG